MNRIVERFALLKKAGKKGFIVYIGAGDPNLEATRQLALAFEKAGVDILELGVPFSDPLADGLVNQRAAQRGLESGTTQHGVLETVAAIRGESELPIVLYIYFNLAHCYGLERFIHDSAKAGVDGLLVLDLPPEESGNYEPLMRAAGLCNIYLVAPTTPDDRIELIEDLDDLTRRVLGGPTPSLELDVQPAHRQGRHVHSDVRRPRALLARRRDRRRAQSDAGDEPGR